MESHEEVMLAPWSGHDPLGMVQVQRGVERRICVYRERKRERELNCTYTGNVDNIINMVNDGGRVKNITIYKCINL